MAVAGGKRRGRKSSAVDHKGGDRSVTGGVQAERGEAFALLAGEVGRRIR
jgi:hypothetical protein